MNGVWNWQAEVWFGGSLIYPYLNWQYSVHRGCLCGFFWEEQKIYFFPSPTCWQGTKGLSQALRDLTWAVLIGRLITGRPKERRWEERTHFCKWTSQAFDLRPLNSLFISDGCSNLQGSGFYDKWSRWALLAGEEDPALKDTHGGEYPSICHSCAPSPSAAHPESFVPVISKGGQSITRDMVLNSAAVVKYGALMWN